VRLPSVSENKLSRHRLKLTDSNADKLMEDPLSVEAIAKFRVRKRDIQGLERLGEQAASSGSESGEAQLQSTQSGCLSLTAAHTHILQASARRAKRRQARAALSAWAK
jgi:hypothetical protein